MTQNERGWKGLGGTSYGDMAEIVYRYGRSFVNSRVAHSGAAYHHKVVTPTGNVYFA